MPRRAIRPALSHLDDRGRVRMVDVSQKAATPRRAVASGVVTVGRELLGQLQAGAVAKGDVLTTAKLAGIQAAKRTAELIPLCHGLAPDFVDVQIEFAPPAALHIRAEARIAARTGVEMEALTAVSVAALTVYDMCKSANKAISIGPIQLEEKSGGKSGTWQRDSAAAKLRKPARPPA